MYIDVFLFSVILTLSILNIFLPHLTAKYFRPFILRCFNGGTILKHQELVEQKQILKNEQNKLHMVNDFAKYSKLQRKINAIDEQLSEIRMEKQGTNFIIRIVLPYISKYFLGIIFVIIIISYRRTPIMILDEHVELFPFSGIISYPNKEPNAVSVHFWLMCCASAAKMIKI